jgi:HSP20 family protein
MLTLWKPKALRNGESSPARLSTPSLFDQFDRLFDQAFDAPVPGAIGWGYPALGTALAADISETADELRLTMDMPGLDPKDLDVRIEGDQLVVRGERKTESSSSGTLLRSERTYGVFQRTFALPAAIDSGKVEARYENGVLTVHLPKREEAKPRTISVKVKQTP